MQLQTKNGKNFMQPYRIEDEKYLYFTAKTPEYGSFAITAKQLEKEQNLKETDENNTGEEENNSKPVTTEKGSEEKTEPKDNTKAPAFELVFGILGLSAAYISKRK